MDVEELNFRWFEILPESQRSEQQQWSAKSSCSPSSVLIRRACRRRLPNSIAEQAIDGARPTVEVEGASKGGDSIIISQ